MRLMADEQTNSSNNSFSSSQNGGEYSPQDRAPSAPKKTNFLGFRQPQDYIRPAPSDGGSGAVLTLLFIHIFLFLGFRIGFGQQALYYIDQVFLRSVVFVVLGLLATGLNFSTLNAAAHIFKKHNTLMQGIFHYAAIIVAVLSLAPYIFSIFHQGSVFLILTLQQLMLFFAFIAVTTNLTIKPFFDFGADFKKRILRAILMFIVCAALFVFYFLYLVPTADFLEDVYPRHLFSAVADTAERELGDAVDKAAKGTIENFLVVLGFQSPAVRTNKEVVDKSQSLPEGIHVAETYGLQTGQLSRYPPIVVSAKGHTSIESDCYANPQSDTCVARISCDISDTPGSGDLSAYSGHYMPASETVTIAALQGHATACTPTHDGQVPSGRYALDVGFELQTSSASYSIIQFIDEQQFTAIQRQRGRNALTPEEEIATRGLPKTVTTVMDAPVVPKIKLAVNRNIAYARVSQGDSVYLQLEIENKWTDKKAGTETKLVGIKNDMFTVTVPKGTSISCDDDQRIDAIKNTAASNNDEFVDIYDMKLSVDSLPELLQFTCFLKIEDIDKIMGGNDIQTAALSASMEYTYKNTKTQHFTILPNPNQNFDSAGSLV